MSSRKQPEENLKKELALYKTKVSNFEAFREACNAKCSRYSIFASIIAHSDDAILSEDLNGNILTWNKGAEKMYGYKSDEMIGSNISVIVPDPVRNDIPWILSRMKEGKNIKNYHTLRKTRDGRIINVALTISPIYDFRNNVSGLAAIARDITKIKAIEESLKKSERRFRDVSTAAKEFIWEIDLDGKFTFVSKSIEKIIGYKVKQILGHAPFEFMPPEDSEKFKNMLLRKFIATGKFKNIEHRFISKKGDVSWHMASAFANMKDDKIVGFYGTTIDITEKVASEKMKEEIDYIMRHDLKAPLNGIIGLPALMKDAENLSEEQKSLLGIIENAGYQMLRMINNSLDIYKLEKGIYSLDPRPEDIISIVYNVSAELSSLIHDKNIKFKINNLSPEKELVVQVEKLLFHSMLANLIKNAIEASPDNETVTVNLTKADDTAIISIVNIGAVNEKIRDRFFQKYTTFGKKQGTGLGSYSANLIANVHNGKISLSCDDEKNLTEISIFLPLKYKKKRMAINENSGSR